MKTRHSFHGPRPRLSVVFLGNGQQRLVPGSGNRTSAVYHWPGSQRTGPPGNGYRESAPFPVTVIGPPLSTVLRPSFPRHTRFRKKTVTDLPVLVCVNDRHETGVSAPPPPPQAPPPEELHAMFPGSSARYERGKQDHVRLERTEGTRLGPPSAEGISGFRLGLWHPLLAWPKNSGYQSARL